MKNIYDNERITTALLLAAGKGSRLYPLTQNSPKCLTLINDKSILERLVINLKNQGFKRLVIVTGHQENCIREFLGTNYRDMEIEYIFSPLYKTTNNIYSLWMARNVINEPFMLIESDLIFDVSLLDDMCYPDRMAVALMRAWMNGTTVTVDSANSVTGFQNGTTENYNDIRYKTVNVYSFSLSSWHAIVERLDQYISLGRVNNYYETVFAEMVADGSLNFQTVSFDDKSWYEIDTISDLAEAEKLFLADIHKADLPDNIILPSKKISAVFEKRNRNKKSSEFVA